mgnify:FL=1
MGQGVIAGNLTKAQAQSFKGSQMFIRQMTNIYARVYYKAIITNNMGYTNMY